MTGESGRPLEAGGRGSLPGQPLPVHERLRAMLRTLHQIDPRQDLESLLEDLSRAVRDETGAVAAAVVIRRDDRGTEMGVVAPAPPRDPFRYLRIWTDPPPPLGGTDGGPLFLRVGETGYPPLLPYYSRQRLRLATTLSSPLLRRGLRFGFLEVINPGDDEWSSPEGLQLFEVLAGEVAVLLDNALLLDRLRRERLENELLYSVSQKISLSVDPAAVTDSIIDSLRLVVPYDAAAIFLLDARTLEVAEETIRGYQSDMAGKVSLKVGEGLVGWAAKTGQSVIVPDVRLDPRYLSARDQTRGEMVAPLKIGGEVVGVFNLESDRVNAYTPHELRLLETFASHAALAIERSRLLRQQIEKERLDRELRIARRIQLSFLPDRDPDWPGFDVSGYNISSEQVSGDFFDYIPVSGPNWGVVIADVSGKGMPASLIMATLRAALWAEVRNTYALAEICGRINTFLYQSLDETEFVTAVYGVLDLQSRWFTYANAGHLAPIHLRSDGSVAFLTEGGLILGAFPDVAYCEGRVRLSPGDLLLLYTDGAVEAVNDRDEEFGRDRLVQALTAARNLTARGIRTELVDRIREFTGRDRLDDDLTFVVIRSLPPPGEMGTMDRPGAGS